MRIERPNGYREGYRTMTELYETWWAITEQKE